MTSIRVSVALVTLLAAAAMPAGAQRWGGGGPGVSQPRVRAGARARVIYRVPVLVVVPSVRVEDRDDFRRRPGGGSWDGSRPGWGGSPPVPGPNYSAFFGYVSPRGHAITQSAPAVEPMRTRDAYRMRRGTP
jgi:hypothetical protein